MARTDRDKKGVEEKPSNKKKRTTLKPTKTPKYQDWKNEESPNDIGGMYFYHD